MSDSESNTVGPWPEPPIPEFDSEKLMVPPWFKFPNLPRGSMGWRMGIGEEYKDKFSNWLMAQTGAIKLRIREKYSEPPEWEGFYNKMKNGS